jgi:hypothetical protein
MTEKSGCDLAVRMNEKSYFVEGTKIDDHGDAHADDGFCSTVRTARHGHLSWFPQQNKIFHSFAQLNHSLIFLSC